MNNFCIYRIGINDTPFKTPKIKCYILKNYDLENISYINIAPSTVYLYKGDRSSLLDKYSDKGSITVKANCQWSIGEYPTESLDIEEANIINNNKNLNIQLKENNIYLDQKFTISLYADSTNINLTKTFEVINVGDREIFSGDKGESFRTKEGETITAYKN